MKLKIILIVILFSLPVSVFAAPEVLTPTFVGCHPSGICYIGVSPPATMTSCPNKGQVRFDISNPGSNPQYSAALSALMGGKNIQVNLTDDCLNGYPTPNWLHVLK
jgi:hypothetical protein